MSFGFSVGDFINVTILIKDIITCLKASGGSASEYQELMRELDGLQSALTGIEHLRASPDRTPTVNCIKVAALSCQYLLRDFLTKLETYGKSLAAGKTRGQVVDCTKKIKYEFVTKTEVQNLRIYLMMHTNSLNMRLLTEGLATASIAANQTEHNQQALLQRFDDAQSAIQGISNDVSRTLETLQQFRGELQDKESLDVVARLSPLHFETKQKDILSRHQEGTGKWMLDSKEFNDWLSGPGRTLWCPGIPGAGKTVLASIVIDNLRKRYDPGVGIACIYCNYKEKDAQTPTNLVVGLWAQLVRRSGFVSAEVRDLYFTRVRQNSPPTLDEVSKILQGEIARYSKIFVVIDALDECPEAYRSTLLKKLRELRPAINLMVTSRPLDAIENDLAGSPQLEIGANVEDIRAYIVGRIAGEKWLSRFVSKDATLGENIVDTIAGKAKKMFLLPQFHMDSLATKLTANDVKKALKTLPNDIRETYDEAMERIESQCSDHKQLAIRILYWIFYALRPFTIQELQHALAVKPETSEVDEDDIPDKELLTSLCAGLVVTDQKSNVIRLVHETVQEYFERTKEKWFPEAQKDIAMTCLQYLSFDAFLDGYCTSDEIFEARLQQNPLFDYAARNWGHYVRGNAEQSVQDLALKLLKDDSKLSGLSQALLVSEEYRYPGYSQSPSKQFSGMHVVAYFGLRNIMTLLLAQDGADADSKDGYGQTPLSWAVRKGHEAVAKLLLEREGVNPDAKDDRGRTPLLWAAKKGHEAVVRLLLARKGVDPNSRDGNRQTPLLWAAKKGHEAVVKLLLAREAVDLNSRDIRGRTPLLWAAENGHEAVAKLLLAREDVDPDFKDVKGRTPLSWAAENGHGAVVKLLLTREGVNPDSKDGDGQRPLSWAAQKGHEAVVKLLLAKEDVDPDSKDGNRQTPLLWAAKNGHEPVVKLLLASDAVDPNSKDKWGRTPLSWATRNGNKAIVKLLLAREGVDPDSKGRYGQTPLSLAAANGQEAVVRLLLAREGVDPDSRDEYSQTPLSWAAQNGHEAVMKLLLAKEGVNPDSKDKYGQSPLSWAAENGHETTVELLLARDADPDSKDVRSRTPLSWAAENGHEAVVELLLAREDVDPDSRDTRNRTPLLWAAQNGHGAVVKLLLAREGINPDSKDGYGQTPLSWAAENGHEAVVRLLLARQSVNPDSKDRYSQTPLSWAAENGHEAVMKLLLARELVDPDSKDVRGRTPLSWAAENGHEAAIKLLLARDDVNPDSKDGSGQTPLSRATRNGHETVVKLLHTRKGVDLDSKDEFSQTLVPWAAENEHEAVANCCSRDRVSTQKITVAGQCCVRRPLVITRRL